MSVDLNHTAQEYAERWQMAEERARRSEASTASLRAVVEASEKLISHAVFNTATGIVCIGDTWVHQVADALFALARLKEEQ